MHHAAPAETGHESLDRALPHGHRPLAQTLTTIAFYTVNAGLVCWFLLPIVWLLLSSFKPASELLLSPPTWFPNTLTIENYRGLNACGASLWGYLINSALVSLGTIIGTAVLATFAGYGFSRFRFAGRRVVFGMILTTMMIPFPAILGPLFYLFSKLGLQNSLFGLTLVYVTFQLPFAVFMMRNTFDAIPVEIEEAAMLEGCGALGILLRVLLPLVSPGIVTVMLVAFLGAWNEFLAALIFMTDQDRFTLPVMLVSITKGQYGNINWGNLHASVVLSLLPPAILFSFLQRYYVSGLTAGATKG